MLSTLETIQIRMQKDLDESFKQMINPFQSAEDISQNSVSTSSIVQKYTNDVFVLPIHTIKDKETTVHELAPSIATDLELEENMYSYLFDLENGKDQENCKNTFANDLMPKWKTHFTSNVAFLEDTQQVISRMPFVKRDDVVCTVPNDTIKTNWASVKHDPQFCEHYGYLEWDMLKEFNQSSSFLQALSIAHILSPLMSFFIPFLFLLFPFIILKFQGVSISFPVYMNVLKQIAKNHFIGKAIIGMENFSVSNLIYLLFMLGLYLLQMYQNTMQCLRFYRNVQKINRELCEWKEFCEYSISNMNAFLEQNRDLETYKSFCMQVSHHRMQLNAFQQLLTDICPFKCNWRKTAEIGYMLQCYYELHINENYAESILFAMGFDGYVQLMHGLYNNMRQGLLGAATFVVDDDKISIHSDISGEENVNIVETTIESQYYPVHMYDLSCVKNDVSLDSNVVITGPNASGKTTYLKTTALNIIFSQQVGVGFYSTCKLNPYQHIHSYLNIPDTSGRDSLFQAESRRCKEILTCIQDGGDNERHFCIFDELYSGTNPEEATRSAFAFMEYIRTFKQVDLILTTHYSSICDRWTEGKNKRHISNKQMEVCDVLCTIDNDNDSTTDNENDSTNDNDSTDNNKKEKVYCTFKIIPGVSKREGAVRILEEMDYPQEMIDMVVQQNDKEKIERSNDVTI